MLMKMRDPSISSPPLSDEQQADMAILNKPPGMTAQALESKGCPESMSKEVYDLVLSKLKEEEA